MNFRRIFSNTISAATAFLIASDFILSPVKAKCPETKMPSYYVAGLGSKLADCVNSSYEKDYREISDFFQVKDTTIPEYGFGILPEPIIGRYDTRRDFITFDTNNVMSFGGSVICSPTKRHEFAHASGNRKSKEIGNGRFPRFSTNNRRFFTYDDYGVQLISEGLANYIGDQETAIPSHITWPTSREEFFCSNVYTLGNYMVGYFLKKYGRSSIPIILKNPPRGTEVLRPMEWQRRIEERILRGRK